MAIESVKDLDAILALKGKNAGLIVGFPPATWTSASAIKLSGDVNSTNKKFKFPDTHIVFPKSCVSIAPQPGDVIVYLKKGTTFTETAVTAIAKSANTTSGRNEYNEVELTTAPSTETADEVWAVCVKQVEPYIQQSVKIDTSQDESEQERLRSEVKHKLYGSILNTISQDALLGDLDILLDYFFEAYDGIETPPAGVEVFQQASEPKEIYAYIPLEKGSTIVGFVFLPRARAACKGLLDVSVGDDMKYSVEIAVDEKILVVRPTA